MSLTQKDGEEFEFGPHVDVATFEQILEMDDGEDDREFSKGIVFDFLQQAENTFEEIDKALEEKDLAQLSALGHFLKGSSATLGFTILKDACEKIQNLGKLKNETGETDMPDEEKCLEKIAECLADGKNEYDQVNLLMRNFFDD